MTLLRRYSSGATLGLDRELLQHTRKEKKKMSDDDDLRGSPVWSWQKKAASNGVSETGLRRCPPRLRLQTLGSGITELVCRPSLPRGYFEPRSPILPAAWKKKHRETSFWGESRGVAGGGSRDAAARPRGRRWCCRQLKIRLRTA